MCKTAAGRRWTIFSGFPLETLVSHHLVAARRSSWTTLQGAGPSHMCTPATRNQFYSVSLSPPFIPHPLPCLRLSLSLSSSPSSHISPQLVCVLPRIDEGQPAVVAWKLIASFHMHSSLRTKLRSASYAYASCAGAIHGGNPYALITRGRTRSPHFM